MIENLRCPHTRLPLSPAPAVLAEKLLATRESLRTRDGEIPAPFEGGLLTSDGAWFYPLRGGIPILLPGEAIALPLA